MVSTKDFVQKNNLFSLTGGVIFTIYNVDQAKMAEEVGGLAVIVADEKTNFDHSLQRLSYLEKVRNIKKNLSIPVIARCRIGHFVEAQILESLGIDCIDESETLNKADEECYINKHKSNLPFLLGAGDSHQALQRIQEGAAFLRTSLLDEKNDQNDANFIQGTVRSLRQIRQQILRIINSHEDELTTIARDLKVSYALLHHIKETKKLPVPLLAAQGIITPADVALMMQLGADGVIIDLKCAQSIQERARSQALVKALEHCREPEKLAEYSMLTMETHSQAVPELI